jgi:hypothetical protein
MKTRKKIAKGQVIVRAPADVIEVLDRVLDRGIVIDAWLRVSVVGLRLVDVDVRIVVASIRTYVREGEAVAGRGTMARSTPKSPEAERPAAPRAPRRRARPKRRAAPKVMLRCAQGCTFLRSAARKAPVRCPSDRARQCEVSAVAT